jgi:S-adenosylmethionine hydrolase
VPAGDLGPAAGQTVSLPRLEVGGDTVRGEVIHIDHFGNVVTSIGRLDWQDAGALALTPRFGAAGPVTLPSGAQVTAGPVTLNGIRPSYGHVGPGEALALVNSAGQLELAVNQGSAAEALGIGMGEAVCVKRQ